MTKRVANITVLFAVSLFGASSRASALPVSYNVTYTALQGPNGVGSFYYDDLVGAITDFRWDFEGVIGGLSDAAFGTNHTFGDTRGRFVFEMLTRLDVHAGVNCQFGGCATTSGTNVEGAAPFGATNLLISNDASGAYYQFLNGSSPAQGSISIAAVPEPSTLAMFSVAVIGLRAMRRRTRHGDGLRQPRG